jgi:hypothetical protein
MKLNIFGEIDLNNFVLGFIVIYLILIIHRYFISTQPVDDCIKSSIESGATGLIYGLAYSGTVAGGIKNSIIWACIGGIKRMVT